MKDAKIKDEEELVTSPIKFENGENDSPKKKKSTKTVKSKSKTPKTNSAKKLKTEKDITPKSASSKKQIKNIHSEVDEEKETENVPVESNSNKNEAKNENVKTEKESPQPKKAAPIHSFFTSKKESKSQSTSTNVSGLEYNPGKSKYHPIDDAFWKHGEKYVFGDCFFMDVNSNDLLFQSTISSFSSNV